MVYEALATYDQFLSHIGVWVEMTGPVVVRKIIRDQRTPLMPGDSFKDVRFVLRVSCKIELVLNGLVRYDDMASVSGTVEFSFSQRFALQYHGHVYHYTP